jgi:hypothetical protein
MVATFYRRRSQPFRYKIPRPKNTIVLSTKRASLIFGLPNRLVVYGCQAKETVSATLRNHKHQLHTSRVSQNTA